MKRILIVGPAWVGDLIMAQTLFMVLKQQHPDCQLDVLAPEWTLPLLDRMPQVNQSIRMPLKHGQFSLRARYAIGKQLRAIGYDQAIVLPNSWKSALVPFFANIPIRTGWVGEARYGLINDIRSLDKAAYPLMIHRFMALGLAAGEELPKAKRHPRLVLNEQTVQAAIVKHGIQLNQNPILALCPGAEFGPSKQYPARHVAEVANQKLDQGYDVFIFGSKKEQSIASEIQVLTHWRCVDLTGKTTLDEAVDLLSLADLCLTNDSGLMHVAAALKIPLAALYGSSSPQFTPPLGEAVRILSLNLTCSPCFKRKCPLKHSNCLQAMPPALALGALDELAAETVELEDVVSEV